MQALRSWIDSGLLGTIMHAEGNYSHDWLANVPPEGWRSAPEETRAGGMTGMGIHVLDCFRDLVGPIARVSALSKRRALPLATGDTTAALVEFANGATGTLATTLKTPFTWRIAIYGEDAWAESVSETRAVLHRAKGEPEVKDFPPNNHLRLNVKQFATAALGGDPFPIDHAGILQTVAALEAVFKLGRCRRGVAGGLGVTAHRAVPSAACRPAPRVRSAPPEPQATSAQRPRPRLQPR